MTGLSSIDTITIILKAAGALGMFLMGMVIMTDGLKAVAGDSLRMTLLRFTRTPSSGIAAGAVCTAILQSSSATTVAAVGFVGAGILAFPEALGIILGANIGTTVTGWLVVLLGFKLKIGTVILPVILLGAILRLFGQGRLSNIGFAMAGFGMLFVGISMMQEVMSGLQSVVTPDDFPPDTLIGRLQLLGFGILITVITQSSSAGVATALAALYAGAINFNQAAALVIGMDVGTTIKAVLATIGGSAATKRTGYSHFIYNLMTAVLALVILTPFTLLWEWISPGSLLANKEIALVAFQTTFNGLGVLLILPFTHRFADLMYRIVPEKGPVYTRSLDDSLLKEPNVALDAVLASIKSELTSLFQHTRAMISGNLFRDGVNLIELQHGLDSTHVYLDQIKLDSRKNKEWSQLVSFFHTLDHMQRLQDRCEEDNDRAKTARTTEELAGMLDTLDSAIDKIAACIADDRWPDAEVIAESTAESLATRVITARDTVMTEIASDKINVRHATEILEGIRWIHRVSQHAYRITFHLNKAMQ